MDSWGPSRTFRTGKAWQNWQTATSSLTRKREALVKANWPRGRTKSASSGRKSSTKRGGKKWRRKTWKDLPADQEGSGGVRREQSPRNPSSLICKSCKSLRTRFPPTGRGTYRKLSKSTTTEWTKWMKKKVLNGNLTMEWWLCFSIENFIRL